MDKAEWIAAGAAEGTTDGGAAPPTPETPADVSPPAPAEAVTDVGVEPVEAPAAPLAAPPPEAPPPPPLIQAQLDGKPYELRADVRLPWKRGTEEGFATLDEIRAGHMLHRDYTQKAQRLAEQQRDVEERRRDVEAAGVRAKAELELLKADRQRWQEAHDDPTGEKLAAWERHQSMILSDPEYKKRWQESNEHRINQAESEWREEQDHRAYTDTVTQRADAYIRDAATKAGVDADRIRSLYAAELSSGRLTRMHADDVDRIIQRETANREQILKPVTDQLEALKQELAALKSTAAITAHNAKTDERIANAQGAKPGIKVGRPVSGQPPAPGKTPIPATLSHEERRRMWIAQG